MSDIPGPALQLCVLVSALVGVLIIGVNLPVRQTVALPVETVKPVKHGRKS